ncbi:MAG: carbamoyltransferase C-terminal domain-containing protein, partial [Patescibacteria group bacterium]
DGYGIDDKGKPLCGSIYLGQNGNLKFLEEIPVYSSIALYYGAVTIALGFKLNDGEGKTMGLAAYGKDSSAVTQIRKIFPIFRNNKWIPNYTWLEVNGVSRPEYFKKTSVFKKFTYLIKKYGRQQLAYAAQKVLEEEGEKFIRYLVKKYKERKVALAGGIFLNVKFNMRLLKNKVVEDLFIYPNPSDGGVCVGAAIALYKRLGGEFKTEKVESAYLGCGWKDSEVRDAIIKFREKIDVKMLGNKLAKTVAKDISEGSVVGWFQGRGEWGPRALGRRSVLADPRKITTKERINKYLKQRDWFMPFAPVILEEYKDKILKHGWATPFMTLTDDVNKEYLEKIPAAIHIDGTARAQIINKSTNPLYWQVINEFRKITSVPVLLNTSFNRHGLPIVHSPKEAIEHLIWGCVDELVIGEYIVSRKE